MAKCPVDCYTCNHPQSCVQYGRSERVTGEADINKISKFTHVHVIFKNINQLLEYIKYNYKRYIHSHI